MEKVTGQRLFFGPFELHTDSGELFRDGTPVRIQPQPARLLELLARRSGEVVTREEIQRHLWGEDTFVEFEQGLNFSIRKLRLALGDSAGEPRYLETIPRRGYRFLVPVTTGMDEEMPALAAPSRRWWSAALPLLVLVLFALLPGPPSEGEATDPTQGLSPRAYQAFNEGRFLAHRGTPTDRQRALAYLQEAILLAPDFARAYSTYARVRLDFSRPAQDSVPAAENAARKAIALDPRLVEPRLVLVRIALYFGFDWEEARRGLDEALALDPENSDAHRAHAAYLASQGRLGEALAAARRALILNPRSAPTAGDVAWYTFLNRRYKEALDAARRASAIDPEEQWARWFFVEAAFAAGETEVALAQARALLAKAQDRPPLPAPPERLTRLRDFWEWQLQALTARESQQPVPAARLAVLALYLGDRERALRLLEDPSRSYGYYHAFLAVDPRFDPLRGEPRFQKVLQALGLAS